MLLTKSSVLGVVAFPPPMTYSLPW